MQNFQICLISDQHAGKKSFIEAMLSSGMNESEFADTLSLRDYKNDMLINFQFQIID
jgi:hypothetical protein